MPELYRKRQLAAKVETSKGSAATLTNADAGILIEDVKYKINAEELVRNPLRSSISSWKSIAGARTATVMFRVEIKNSGTDHVPPSLGPLIRACGFAQTIATASVHYDPVSGDDNFPTLTMGVYTDDMRWLMVGARGTFSIEANANRVVYLNFTFTGIHSAWEYAAVLTSVSYETTVPVPFRSTSTTFNFGTSLTSEVYSRWTMDLNNSVVVRENANSANGLSYAQIVARDPGGTFDIDVPPVTHDTSPNIETGGDFVSHWLTPTTGSLSITLGGTNGNIFEFTAPTLQVVDIGDGERDGICTHDITYKLRSATGVDDDMILTFK
jgi:hypothetical protein